MYVSYLAAGTSAQVSDFKKESFFGFLRDKLTELPPKIKINFEVFELESEKIQYFLLVALILHVDNTAYD